MTNQEIQIQTNNIISSIKKRQLKKSFDSIALLINEIQDWLKKERLNELETTYRLMLHYMLDGAKDPQRKKVYNDLLKSSYELADSIFLALGEKYSPNYYFEYRRNSNISSFLPYSLLEKELEENTTKLSLTDLLENDASKKQNSAQFQQNIENSTGQLFNKIWLSNPLNEEESDAINSLMNNTFIPVSTKCVVISAVTLSLQHFLDEHKALLLFEAYQQENEEIRQRALIGLLIFLYKYDDRLFLYPQIINRLQHHFEDKDFVKNMLSVIRQFILSKQTENITKKINEELLPEMMKISPSLSKKIKLDDLMSDAGDEGKNPEWQEILEKAGLTDKLKELTELQMEGADVMHSSFSNLKHYSFFDKISNWFLLFSSSHSSLNTYGIGGKISGFADILSKMGYICNSDKYSLYFSLSQMPESYREMMTNQLSGEAAEWMKQEKESLSFSSKKAETIVNQYIHDLYRFFKVHPRHKDFEDIFNSSLSFHKISTLRPIFSNEENLMIIGEYYFNKNNFEEAAEIFKILSDKKIDNNVFFEKIGYCLQMMGNTTEALEEYLKADLANPNNSWILKKIAFCYKTLKNHQEALAYYQRIELLDADNLSVLLNIGHCHLELKNYSEALKYYFKVEYLGNQKNNKAWRPIAWCSFLTGKFDQAITYYQKILSDSPNAADYLNYGHTLLAKKNNREAINAYKMSIKLSDDSKEKFVDIFSVDIPELLQAGIDAEDIPIILDQSLYNIE